MGILTGTADFFGLDIGTTAIRGVQLKGSGTTRSLYRYASIPVDSRIVQSDSNSDLQKLSEAVKQLMAQAKFSTNNVAVGIPSQRVFSTVVDFDRLSPQELEKTIRYQADSLIPTPLSESKIDWAIIGDSPKEATKVEVLLTSVPNEFVEKRLDMLENLGLNVIAFEPDNIALARALLEPGSSSPQLIVDVGNLSTDIVICFNDAPHLVRSVPTGTDAILKSAMQNLGVDDKQAQQFVFKFALAKDILEGQVANAISGTVEVLIAEIEKSIKFFQTRYTNLKLEKIIVTGGASTLPEFPLYIANKFAMNVEIGNAWRNVSFPDVKQSDLLAVSNHFGVASGLASRNE